MAGSVRDLGDGDLCVGRIEGDDAVDEELVHGLERSRCDVGRGARTEDEAQEGASSVGSGKAAKSRQARSWALSVAKAVRRLTDRQTCRRRRGSDLASELPQIGRGSVDGGTALHSAQRNFVR